MVFSAISMVSLFEADDDIDDLVSVEQEKKKAVSFVAPYSLI